MAPKLGEFDRIEHFFKPLAKGFPGALNLSDDAATIAVPPGQELVVTTDALDGAVLVASLRAGGELPGTKVLGFYSHVEQDVRRRAEEAGFDLVVPRSRMAREGAELVGRLAGG